MAAHLISSINLLQSFIPALNTNTNTNGRTPHCPNHLSPHWSDSEYKSEQLGGLSPSTYMKAIVETIFRKLRGEDLVAGVKAWLSSLAVTSAASAIVSTVTSVRKLSTVKMIWKITSTPNIQISGWLSSHCHTDRHPELLRYLWFLCCTEM